MSPVPSPCMGFRVGTEINCVVSSKRFAPFGSQLQSSADLGHAHDDGIQKRGVEATDYKILQGYYNRHSSLSLDITGMGHHGSSDMR